MSGLTEIIPIVRGLLADPTGNQDMPCEPVILKSLTGKEAIDGFDKLTIGFDGSAKNAEVKEYPAPLSKSQKPPLFLDTTGHDTEPENQEDLEKANFRIQLLHQLHNFFSLSL